MADLCRDWLFPAGVTVLMIVYAALVFWLSHNPVPPDPEETDCD